MRSHTWIERQWIEAVRRLKGRPPTRRGQTIISNATLDRAERRITQEPPHDSR